MQCLFGIRRPARGAGQGLTALHMTNNLRNQRRILDGGDDPELTAAFRAGFDVDGEYPLKALHPTHRGGPRCLKLGAKTPWNRVRFNLGRGTRAASRAIKSSGSSTTWVEPSRNGCL